MKVLIVDDEEDIRQIAKFALTMDEQTTVIEAQSGAEALHKARSEKPDVILLDIMMPGMNGTETLLALKKEPEIKSIPVIFLTARSTSEYIKQLKHLGARGVVTKPFDPVTLADDVNAILKGK